MLQLILKLQFFFCFLPKYCLDFTKCKFIAQHDGTKILTGIDNSEDLQQFLRSSTKVFAYDKL